MKTKWTPWFAPAGLQRFDWVLFRSLDQLSLKGVSVTLGYLEGLASYRGVGARTPRNSWIRVGQAAQFASTATGPAN